MSSANWLQGTAPFKSSSRDGGNEIPLFIHEPADRGAEGERPLPGIVHTHGGGMGVFSADDPQYRRWKDELAARGMVVVGVEFRKSAGKLGNLAWPHQAAAAELAGLPPHAISVDEPDPCAMRDSSMRAS